MKKRILFIAVATALTTSCLSANPICQTIEECQAKLEKCQAKQEYYKSEMEKAQKQSAKPAQKKSTKQTTKQPAQRGCRGIECFPG